MKVKNILVTNKEVFIELLIKELINNSISYVQIDNEFHFEDKIYRFYDANDYQNAKAANLTIEVLNLMDIKDLASHNLEESLTTIGKDDYQENELFTPKINKKYIKQQNRQYNSQIKNGFRNKRK